MHNSPAKIPGITGVILAGGRSRRFGSDKTLALWRGQPLIEHAAGVLTSLFPSCLVVTNNPAAHRFLGLPMAGDLYPGCGPLAGIHAALRTIADERACVVAADMPLLSPALLRYLCRLSDDECRDAVIPWLESGAEPLCGIYRKRILATVEESLRQGRLKVADSLGPLSVHRATEAEILAAGADPASLTNINRPEDLHILTG